jgi:hypothetical protein
VRAASLVTREAALTDDSDAQSGTCRTDAHPVHKSLENERHR